MYNLSWKDEGMYLCEAVLKNNKLKQTALQLYIHMQRIIALERREMRQST